MPTTNHSVTISINGSDKTSLLLQDSLFIRSSIRNEADTASFLIRDNGTYSPSGWHEVTIAVNGTNVFGGYIVTKNVKDVGVGNTYKKAHWNITCRDWSVLFDQTIVNYGYTDSDDTVIIADLFSRYLSSDGFDSATEVTNVKDDLDIFFENISFREALNQLAGICGADWHVAPDKSLYWYATDAPADAAFTIDTVNPNNSTTFDVLANTVDILVDEATIINRATVVGGERLLPGTSDVFAVDGTKFRYSLSAKPNSINFISYVIGGTAYYARSEDIGFEPGDEFAYDGGNYDVLVNIENRYVAIKNIDGTLPDVSTGIVANYYPSETVITTVESAASQSGYARVFAHTVYDENLTSTTLATNYAQRIIDEYEFGRTTVMFSITEHGLLPGRLITINMPVLEIEPTTTGYLQTEDFSFLLLENDDNIFLESSGAARKFLIQEVEIYPVASSSQDDFMIVAKINCGKYIPSLFDTLKGIQRTAAAPGQIPATRNVGKISTIANDLGEVRAGRAVFTDGGTAAFAWDDYADHTGVIIGLEGVGSDAQGAMYIMQDGTVRAKVGKVDGLGSVGTVVPSGWGIWTSNGYFTGALNATTGQIGGWTIASNAIIGNGGTISTSAPPLNSSNPGVYMSTAGIFGYGTLGLTFSIPSDPALRPIFSSGTILETVYEVTNAAVIRTGTIFPKVQIDNSGIFAYNSGGTALFTVDSNTGRMTAVDGVFSGSVTASQISGGTVSGGLVSGGTVSGGSVISSFILGGTISAAGGQILLDESRMKFIAPVAWGFGTPTLLEWQTASGGTVAQITSLGSGNISQMYQIIGTAGQAQGNYYLRVYGTALGTVGDYSQMEMSNTGISMKVLRNAVNYTPTTFAPGTILTDGNVYPLFSNSDALGNATHAWTALYLHDGTDEWRITINSSGVLQTVKV